MSNATCSSFGISGFRGGSLSGFPFQVLCGMRERVVEPELMDDPNLDPAEHRLALRGLSRLNRFTGVADAVYRRLRRLSAVSPRPLRVLDVATGSGDLPIRWLKLARRDGFPLQVTGVDMSPLAVSQAGEQAERNQVEADWLVANVLEDDLPNDFDVVCCSLFLHHFEDDDVVQLLRVMRDATDRGGELRRLLVCDLARSRLNLTLVSFAAQLVTRSPVVHCDAALSVRAAMTRREFEGLAETALGFAPRVEPLLPCRFLAEIPLA
ncbi:methyltransferase domain-containing protein [Planctomycetaceae bacterium SH139]